MSTFIYFHCMSLSLSLTFSGDKEDEFEGIFTNLSDSGRIDIFTSLISVTESSFYNEERKGVHAITNKW